MSIRPQNDQKLVGMTSSGHRSVPTVNVNGVVRPVKTQADLAVINLVISHPQIGEITIASGIVSYPQDKGNLPVFQC